MTNKTHALACASLLLAGGAAWADFDLGVREFHARRYAAAWGNFYSSANAGDPDAARVALHMLKYGPVLYGGFWDASTEEVDAWKVTAESPRARPTPAYQPPVAANGHRR